MPGIWGQRPQDFEADDAIGRFAVVMESCAVERSCKSCACNTGLGLLLGGTGLIVMVLPSGSVVGECHLHAFD